jgi:hypothetical protein
MWLLQELRFRMNVASFIRVERVRELGITLAATGIWRTIRRNTNWWWRQCVPRNRRFLQEPHGVTSQERHISWINANGSAITFLLTAILSSLNCGNNIWHPVITTDMFPCTDVNNLPFIWCTWYIYYTNLYVFGFFYVSFMTFRVFGWIKLLCFFVRHVTEPEFNNGSGLMVLDCQTTASVVTLMKTLW